ncbi:cell division protein FtsY homolog, chloroplastic-like isoform X4 [Prunus dulcis]|uniref:cell division protein FtsY homolog, chloroplastic-like isoform X4 n=1 Tax=Prunus dulcis TaxID=3755 RepID=UPI001483530A|nr:cell division protein FtsY homolog, chloroplastic-like isoform X4 [Prunus dulcis]
MASPLPSSLHRLSLLSKPSPSQNHRLLVTPTRPELSRFECRAGQTGFFTRLGRLIKEKAKSDLEKLFSGFSKTRDNLAVIDELLLYWNLADTDRVLDELEEALLVSDFGPKITIKIVESLREDIVAGKLKSGSEIKEALKKSVLDLLTTKGSKTELQLGYRKPAVVMIVGVNGGGKTTSLGKLAYRLKEEGAKQGIHFEQLPVTSWRYGLRGQGVRLLWLKKRRLKQHQCFLNSYFSGCEERERTRL